MIRGSRFVCWRRNRFATTRPTIRGFLSFAVKVAFAHIDTPGSGNYNASIVSRQSHQSSVSWADGKREDG